MRPDHVACALVASGFRGVAPFDTAPDASALDAFLAGVPDVRATRLARGLVVDPLLVSRVDVVAAMTSRMADPRAIRQKNWEVGD